MRHRAAHPLVSVAHSDHEFHTEEVDKLLQPRCGSVELCEKHYFSKQLTCVSSGKQDIDNFPGVDLRQPAMEHVKTSAATDGYSQC